LCEKQLQIARVGEHARGFARGRENIPLVKSDPKNGLPIRVYLPILAVTVLAFAGIIGYFLKVGLGVTGSAIGPEAGVAVVASAAPQDALPSQAPGEVVVPQTGGAPQGVGGGTPLPQNAGGPPAPVMRLLVEMRGRLQRDPNDLAALVNLANMYFDSAKYAQSLPYYRRALALDPANPDTRTDYATALHGNNQDLQSLAELQKVLDVRPDFPEALFNEGIVANAIGRRTMAIAAFKHFLKVAPKDERAGDARTALQNLNA
jgi:hypothetical protein